MTDTRHDREREALLDHSNPHFQRQTDVPVDAETRSMLSAVRACYGPAPLDPSRRAALERSLARRLEKRRPGWRLGAPLLATAVAAAAALIWLNLPATLPAGVPQAVPRPAASQPIAAADTQAADAWVAELFDPPELGQARTVKPVDQDRSLYPADLAAIDVAFLGN